MRKALVVEEKKEKAAKKLERRLQLSNMTHEQREKVWQEEMSEGILGGAEQGEEEVPEKMKEGEEGGSCVLVKRPIRAEERKTKKQRRKEQMRQKEVRDSPIRQGTNVRLCFNVPRK